jgi:chromosome segregation ATPase
MTIKEELKAAQEQIASLQNDLTAARKDSADAAESVTGIRNERDQLAADLTKEKEAHAKSVESLQAVAVEVEQLKAKLVEAEASAGKKAQEALAAIGVPPVNTDVATAETTPAQLQAEYAKLAKTNFAQARDFWKKHEAKLSTPQMLAWKKQNGLY